MSTEQQETLDAILRQSAFPVGSSVDEQRQQLRALLSAQPLPADVTVTAAELGAVPTAEITVDGIEPRHVVLYFHGGVYVMGDAALAADLASQVGRRTHAKAISVDYRLAPEHPYPAAVDDALAAYEAARKPIVKKLVAAARASADWYERFPEHMQLDPIDFAFSYITRSGRIDPARLRAMSPAFMVRYERARGAVSAIRAGEPR